jgi:hypothetical protein
MDASTSSSHRSPLRTGTTKLTPICPIICQDPAMTSR